MPNIERRQVLRRNKNRGDRRVTDTKKKKTENAKEREDTEGKEEPYNEKRRKMRQSW